MNQDTFYQLDEWRTVCTFCRGLRASLTNVNVIIERFAWLEKPPFGNRNVKCIEFCGTNFDVVKMCVCVCMCVWVIRTAKSFVQVLDIRILILNNRIHE